MKLTHIRFWALGVVVGALGCASHQAEWRPHPPAPTVPAELPHPLQSYRTLMQKARAKSAPAPARRAFGVLATREYAADGLHSLDRLCRHDDAWACAFREGVLGHWHAVLDSCVDGSLAACVLFANEKPFRPPDAVRPAGDKQQVALDFARPRTEEEWEHVADEYEALNERTEKNLWGSLRFLHNLFSVQDCLTFRLKPGDAVSRAHLIAGCRTPLQLFSNWQLENFDRAYTVSGLAARALIHYHVGEELSRVPNPPPYAARAFAIGDGELRRAIDLAFDCGCGLWETRRALFWRFEWLRDPHAGSSTPSRP